MDGEIDIEGTQNIGDVVQFLIDRHDPATNKQGSVEKADLAQGAQKVYDGWREMPGEGRVQLLALPLLRGMLRSFSR